jgi:NADH-quinone oxidoreductase subunit H
MKIAAFFLSPIIGFGVGVFFMGLARRIMARIHWRYGPPIIQPLLDIIKLFHQRSVSHGVIFELGVLLSLAGSLVTLLFIPIGNLYALNMSGGLLVILYLMLIAPLGVALSGGEGANPNISIGISRKMLLALSYEVPFLLVILAVMIHYNTISLVKIVELQSSSSWGIVPLPLSGIAFFLVLPAMLGIRPFDVAGAPQEISSGPKVEYGGKFLALNSIEHALHEFIVIALFVNLFLGGSGEPFTFFIKMVIVFTAGVLINAVFPRVRIEQAIHFCWKWPTILAFVGLIIASVMR